jgi:hypothetical protein
MRRNPSARKMAKAPRRHFAHLRAPRQQMINVAPNSLLLSGHVGVTISSSICPCVGVRHVSGAARGRV